MSLNSEPSTDLRSALLSCSNKWKRLYHLRRRGVFTFLWEFANLHFPPVFKQIYLMCQLHCKRGDRIIRIGIRREITEQIDVKAIGIRAHVCSDILNTGCRNPQVEILSISFPPDEIFKNAFTISFVHDFIYFINGTFREANRREIRRVKLSFD